jgi:hypothetical protein
MKFSIPYKICYFMRTPKGPKLMEFFMMLPSSMSQHTLNFCLQVSPFEITFPDHILSSSLQHHSSCDKHEAPSSESNFQISSSTLPFQTLESPKMSFHLMSHLSRHHSYLKFDLNLYRNYIFYRCQCCLHNNTL